MAASRVACASFNIGTNTTITITKDKSSYTHTITYKFGSATGTIATKTTQTSIVWSPAAATLYAQIPNSVSGYGTITCQTYDGNTLIGTTTAGFYAYAVKANCVPAVDGTIVDTNTATIAVTGNSAKLVRYISKPKVTLTATAKNSATIKSRQILNLGGLVAVSTPYTFDTVYDKTFRLTAVDSRGYSTTVEKTADFLEYDPAHIHKVSLKRTESTSTTAIATLEGFCFKGSFGAVSNTLTLKYRYKTSGGSYGSYVSISGATWNTDGAFAVSVNIANLSLNEQYTFEFVAEDKLTSYVSEEVVLTQGVGDLRIGKDYILAKNHVITGDVNNEDWKCFNARRVVGGKKYEAHFGAGSREGAGATAIELYEDDKIVGRYEIRPDGVMYDSVSSMPVAEMLSYAPSIVAGGMHGHCLLRGGTGASPILIQWGRISITPTAANTVTKQAISFNWLFEGLPVVMCEPATAAPGTVSVNVGDITNKGFNIYLERTNTTATAVVWVAIGNGTPSLPI